MTRAGSRNWSGWKSVFTPGLLLLDSLAAGQFLTHLLSAQGRPQNMQPKGWLLLGAHRLTAHWHQEILKFNISSPSVGKSAQEDAHARANLESILWASALTSTAFVTTCHPSGEAGPDLSKGPEHTPALPRCHHFQALHVLHALSSTLKISSSSQVYHFLSQCC